LKYENDLLQKLHSFATISGYLRSNWQGGDLLHGLPNNAVLFAAGKTEDNVELWRSDGTTSGTYLYYDINLTGSAWPDNFVRYNDSLWLFTAFDGEVWAWWYTDGTWPGTAKIIELPGSDCTERAGVSNPALLGNRLYFGFNDGVHGIEPWILEFPDPLTVSSSEIPAPDQKYTLQLSPNPASDYVQVSWSGQAPELVQLTLIDGLGQIVFEKNVRILGEYRLRLPATLANGLYWVRVCHPTYGILARPLVLHR
jgi:ELWxxDGT repeat protein